jgi:hypothetical protein
MGREKESPHFKKRARWKQKRGPKKGTCSADNAPGGKRKLFLHSDDGLICPGFTRALKRDSTREHQARFGPHPRHPAVTGRRRKKRFLCQVAGPRLSRNARYFTASARIRPTRQKGGYPRTTVGSARRKRDSLRLVAWAVKKDSGAVDELLVMAHARPTRCISIHDCEIRAKANAISVPAFDTVGRLRRNRDFSCGVA